MNLMDWAKKEVELACAREKEASKDSKDDLSAYGCACYESALRAFKSLTEDGHSGMSIGITKQILIRLIDMKPLTPIEDTDDIWHFSHTRDDGTKTYQCNRMSSFFKDVHPDGSISYHDINRCYCVTESNPGVLYHNGFISNIFDKMYPVTMPYIPHTNPAKIVCEEFLTDPKNGDFDTIAILYIIDFEGKRVDVNRYFKETESSFVEIDRLEYEKRNMIARGGRK